jgi:acetyltransferase-like isoleucine patch superfamily enzyme
LLTNWLPDNVIFIRFRGWLASPFFKKCGNKIGIGRDITFYNPSRISLGNGVYIAKGCWFLGFEDITIEDNAIFGPYVVIVTANHSYANGSYKSGTPIDLLPVRIGSGSWIAAHCTILPGSIIEQGSLIAANSVFSGKTEPGAIFGGVPARQLKKLDI